MSYVDYVLDKSKDFLNDFVNKKVNDICNHITQFYNYLSIPREGFKRVDLPFWVNTNKCIHILSDKEKSRRKTENMRCERPVISKYFCELHLKSKLEDNITSEDVSTKRINKEMVTYLFSDIYNCKNFTTTTNMVEFAGREKHYIFSQIYNVIDSSLRTSIKDLLLDEYLRDINVIIHHDVEGLIKKYVAICIYNIIFMDLDVDNLSIKYNEMQQYILTYKRDYKDYNLDDNRYNYTLQAFVYVITCLLDWLELNDVTTDEVETAFNIILAPSFKSRIDKIKYRNKSNLKSNLNNGDFAYKFNTYKSNINLAFKELNFDIEEDVCALVLEYVLLFANIASLDEMCRMYDSDFPEVRELHTLLRKMFEGCYNFEFILNEDRMFEYSLRITGNLKLEYFKKLIPDKDRSRDEVIFEYDHYTGNLMFFYKWIDYDGEEYLEDVYFTQENIQDNKHKFVKELYSLIVESYKRLLYIKE